MFLSVLRFPWISSDHTEMDISEHQETETEIPLPIQWKRSHIVIEKHGAMVGTMGARQMVLLRGQSRMQGAAIVNLECSGTLGKRPAWGW